jgi:hypothetical protein
MVVVVNAWYDDVGGVATSKQLPQQAPTSEGPSLGPLNSINDINTTFVGTPSPTNSNV